MPKGYCPECGSSIGLGKEIRKGQQVECYRCGVLLVVRRESPIELDWSYEGETSQAENPGSLQALGPDHLSED